MTILSYDFGKHNADIEKSASRVMESGTWKPQRVIIILPAGKTIPTLVALSHWNLIFPPNNGVYRMVAQGMEVGEAYSEAFKQVINHPQLREWEYILTIEHDNVPPPDGLLGLIEALDGHPEYAAISGLYWTKGEGGVAQIWGDPKDIIPNFRPQVPRVGEVQECCGIGMGFALWRIPALKDERLPEPMFKTRVGKDGVGTQDLYFWGEARKIGLRCAVDTKVRVGHYDAETQITW